MRSCWSLAQPSNRDALARICRRASSRAASCLAASSLIALSCLRISSSRRERTECCSCHSNLRLSPTSVSDWTSARRWRISSREDLSPSIFSMSFPRPSSRWRRAASHADRAFSRSARRRPRVRSRQRHSARSFRTCCLLMSSSASSSASRRPSACEYFSLSRRVSWRRRTSPISSMAWALSSCSFAASSSNSLDSRRRAAMDFSTSSCSSSISANAANSPASSARPFSFSLASSSHSRAHRACPISWCSSTRRKYLSALAAAFSRGSSCLLSSKTMSLRRTKFASVSANFLTASSFRVRYLPMPAASSMINRLSSGRLDKTASIWP